MSLVEVRPIEKDSTWHGIKGKDSFSRPVTIEALVSIQTGQYATGLSQEDRERLESVTGYNLSPDYNNGHPHEFWNSPQAAIKLENKTNVFDTSNPLNEIKVKVMKASDLVANSLREYEEGKFPEALFVIHDETEETEVRATKAAIKRKVIIEATKLTKARKIEIIQILLNTSVKNQSEDYIDLKLDEAIETIGAETVLNLIQRDKARVYLHAMILEGLQKGVLRKEGTSIYYLDDQLGFDIETTIDYFNDTKNQALKAVLLEKINS